MNVEKLVGHPLRTNVGANDVVGANGLTKNVLAPSVLVRSENDLAQLPEYPAGSIAYTAGFKEMWQKDASGSWVSLL